MAELLDFQQGSDVAVTPDGFVQATSPLQPNRHGPYRMAHFSDGVYNLSPESHLSRLLKVLLGDAGIGQLAKRHLLARLQQTFGGTHFFDLDSFYGVIFGVQRKQSELLPADPATAALDPAVLDAARIADGSYRSRIEAFAKGLGLGATAIGIEAVAEAVLGIECNVRELWMLDDQVTNTWSDLEAAGTWGALETYSWGGLESDSHLTSNKRPFKNRHVIQLTPHRPLTNEEEYIVLYALDRIKPAGTLIVIQPLPVSFDIDIPISRAAADSEHWEVRSQVRNTLVNGQALHDGAIDSLVPIVTPAWGSYQGEAWTLMADNPSILAYSTPTDVSKIFQIDPQAKDLAIEQVIIDGKTVSFPPAYAARPIQATMAGRAASDGILVCNPQTTRATIDSGPAFGGSFQMVLNNPTNDPALPAQLYVDGMDINELIAAVSSDRSSRISVMFWTAPPRPVDSTANDVLEVRFAQAGTLNNIVFEFAAFPQTIEIQVRDRNLGQWVTVSTQNYYTSTPAGITGRIPDGALHPYHFGSGHWQRISVGVEPVVCSEVRFVLKRAVGAYPTGFDGKPVSYPLGLRNIDIGYRLDSPDKIPNIDLRNPIATTQNLVGQSVQHSIKKFAASTVIDNSSSTFWKCEAQPVTQAVTSLYLDIRDKFNQPQTFDRIFLDPYTSGPTLNIYWSDQDPEALDLAASPTREEPLLPLVVNGSISTSQIGDGGLSFPKGSLGYIDFDNADIGLDPYAGFYCAMEFYPGYATNLTTTNQTLWSMGNTASAASADLALLWNAGSLTFTYAANGGTSCSIVPSWTPGQKIRVVAQFNPVARTLTLTARNGDGTTFVTNTTGIAAGPIVHNPVPVFRLGKMLSNTTTYDFGMDVRITRFALGYGAPSTFDVIVHMDAYARKPVYQSSTVEDFTDGTVIRFDPSYIGRSTLGTEDFSIGFMGGHPDQWSGIVWNPVARDYVLAKGNIRLPRTRAKYIKLEFTNLMAEPYETFLVHDKPVKVFNPANTVKPPTTNRGDSSDPSPATNQTGISNQTASKGTRATFERYVQAQDPYFDRPSPTAALVVIDPVAASNLSNQAGHGFSYQAWQPNRFAAQFTSRGKHVYSEVNIPHASKVAYFAGLRTVKMFRVDDTAPLDTPIYIDPFFDLYGIESFSSAYDPGVFHSADFAAPGVLVTPQTIVSKTFSSLSNMTALQFGTQQSPSQQLIPDDLFRDPGLSINTFTDSSGWHTFQDGRIIYDPTRSGLRVTRNPTTLVNFITQDTPIVHPPVTPVFTTNPTVGITLTSASQGGIEGPSVQVSAQGMLYVAARVTPTVSLQAPLFLQLIGSDNATVLMEMPFTSPLGVQTEIVMPYFLGAIPSLEGLVRARVVQKGPFRDEWYQQALSIYDDGLLWEFSNDGGTSWVPAINNTRNNFAGVVHFPRAGSSMKWRCTFYRQSVGISTIEVRPWYSRKIGIG